MTADLDHALAPLDFERDLTTGRRRIRIPLRANIAADTLGLHAEGPLADTVAVRVEAADGTLHDTTFAGLDAMVRRVATVLRGLGIGRGDVVAVHGVPGVEVLAAHLATFRIGAIVATLSVLYGPDTVRHVLRDSGATVLVTAEAAWRDLATVRPGCPALRTVLVVGGRDMPGEIGWDAVDRAEPDPGPYADTGPEDPALLVYTSGSTGLPKGVLHGHRVLHAYKPTLELFYDLELRAPGTVLWTHADWGWIAALLDTLYVALQFGHRQLVSTHRYDPDWALGFMARHGVTHALILPTALNRMAQVARPRERWPDLALRVIFTGGEPLPAETVRWIQDDLGVVLNEGYGMSEVNHMIGNCSTLRPIRPGSMGWEFPGHVAALVDERGEPVPDGEVGEIVTVPDTPTLFLGYWKRPDLTAAMRLGRWVRTRDLAVRDADGYYWYRGRNDDLIKSAGRRIGPTEIEDALAAHPAVAQAAVIGVPDPERGQAVMAVVRLADGYAACEALAEDLRAHVRARLGGFKAPRSFEFVAELPTTSTGKVSRAVLRRQHASTPEPERAPA